MSPVISKIYKFQNEFLLRFFEKSPWMLSGNHGRIPWETVGIIHNKSRLVHDTEDGLQLRSKYAYLSKDTNSSLVELGGTTVLNSVSYLIMNIPLNSSKNYYRN